MKENQAIDLREIRLRRFNTLEYETRCIFLETRVRLLIEIRSFNLASKETLSLIKLMQEHILKKHCDENSFSGR